MRSDPGGAPPPPPRKRKKFLWTVLVSLTLVPVRTLRRRRLSAFAPLAYNNFAVPRYKSRQGNGWHCTTP
jgi:hypothetical protein